MPSLRHDTRAAALLDLFSLFAGRVGGILVTLFFIPQYNRLLGAEAFGAVAIVLSLQAFFLVSDLGLATLVSRDTAIAQGDPDALTAAVWTRRRAEALLWVLAGSVAGSAVLLALIGAPWSIGEGANAAMIAALIAVLVATNMVQLSLNALGLYRVGAAAAVVGAVARGGATVLMLQGAPSLQAFLQVQLVVAALHFLAVRRLLERRCRPLTRREPLLGRDALADLLRRCVPLTIYTLASAAAVNLDKSIVSAFISLEAAGAYFLATTYALVPVAVLSGPINSYFTPRVAHTRHAGDPAAERRLGAVFQIVLICAVVGPSLSLMFEMERWLRLWLDGSADVATVLLVAPILLAGGSLYATAYYPASYLVAAEDNRFLAKLSLVTGVAVLALAMGFAWLGQVRAVAWSYFGFYAVGFAALWARMGQLTGRAAVTVFLLRDTLLPGALIAAGYAVGSFLLDGAPFLLGLLGPAALGAALGASVLAGVLRVPPTRA